MDMTKEYAQIMGKQKSEGKVEEVNDPPAGEGVLHSPQTCRAVRSRINEVTRDL